LQPSDKNFLFKKFPLPYEKFLREFQYPATTTMEQFFRRVADTLCVPDMESCLDPGENETSFEGRANARPYPLERGKIGS
jgi:hypothetical protein